MGALRQRAAGSARAQSRLMCEGLEARVLMSVGADAEGWTVVTPSTDSRIIYVSTAGNDATNNGSSPSAAVATVSKARALVRSGFPDQILLRRGDTFFNQTISSWNLSGRNADEPFVIGAYTDPTRPSSQRPKLATGISGGISFTTSTPVSHVYVMGVAFEAHSRNYRQPPANGDSFTTNVLSESQGGTYGLNVFGTTSDLLVEDSSFQYYRTNVSLQTTTDGSGRVRPITDVRLRRNVILDAYAPDVDPFGIVYQHTSEGIYAGGTVDGLTIEGNTVSHNGWTEDNALGAVASIYNHNLYINSNVTGLVVTNNVIADAASHGLQARSGGIVKDNLFLRNPIAMGFGYVNGAVTAGGVSGEVSGNVVVGTGRIVEAGRGWGLELSNLKAASQGGGTVVRNNVYANDLATGGVAAIRLDIGNVSNSSQDVGVNDLLLENNVVYSWARGLYVHPGFNSPSSSSYRPLKNLVVRGNDFQRLFSGSGPMVDHAAPFVGSAEKWSGNRYDGTRADSGTSRWFRVGGSSITFDQWKATYEPTAQRALGLFPDPGRTAGSYNATLGGANSTDAFIEQARRQSRVYSRPEYAARAANEYIRAGYAGGRVDIAAPTASADAENVTVAGAASHAFTVTYSDDNKLNLSSLGGGDVRVVGPNGFSAAASLVSSTGNAEGDRRTVTYSVAAPGGEWSAAANGLYSVVVQGGEVLDVTGKAVAADPVGSFSVTIDPAVPGAVASAPGIGRDNAAATVTVTYTGGTTPALPTSVSPLNAGFETPNVGADTSDAFQYAPVGGAWTFNAASGISGNNSDLTWSNPAAPQGAQVAFIQGAGTITQSVTDWQAGTYTVSFKAAQRGAVNTAGQNFEVQVDGQTVGAFTPSGPAYESFTTASFTVAAGAHTIRFVGLNTAGGDNTALLDDVQVTGATTPAQQSISAATLSAADVRLTGPNGYSAAATSAGVDAPGVDGTRRVVTYTVPAPAGGWSSVAGDASYPVNVVAGQVTTTSGAAVPAAKIGAVRVKIDAPAATVSAGNITAGSTAAHTFTVTYVDSGGTGGGGGIAPSIDSADLRVTGPGGFNAPVTLASFTGTGSPASPLVATYRVAAPVGGWGVAANGAYFVNAQANQVTDADGNALPAGSIGQFQVAVDTTPPLAWASENPIVSPTPLGATPSTKIIGVSYSDVSGINLTTLDNSDIRVLGPIGFDQLLTKAAVTSSPTAADVDYTLSPPAGGWKSRHNGWYSIVLQPAQVRDGVGNALTTARTLTTFQVNLETVAPTAQVGPVTPNPRNTALAATTIVFDEIVTGLDLGDFSLTRDGAAVALTGATFTTADNKTYTLGGLAGLTGGAGAYALTVTAAGSGVVDLAGNAMAANAAAQWTVDLTAPTASASATPVTNSSGDGHSITVTYADNLGINASTIDGSDLLVTGPGGYSANAQLVSVSGSGTSRTAVYAATPPAGGWTAAHAGTYSVALRANQVADSAGNFAAAGVIGSFDVAIVPPPTASIGPVTPSPRNTSVASVTVNFDQPVTGFDLADLSLTNNGAPVSLAGATLSSTDNQAFTLAGLSGATSAAGAYVLTVTAAGSGIVNASGIAIAADAATQWTTDVTAPTVNISAVTPNPRQAPVDSVTVTFSEPVAGFDVADLALTRNGSAVSLAGVTVAAAGETGGDAYTVGGLSAATTPAGAYTLSVTAAGSGIADPAGNTMSTAGSTTFTVEAPAVGPVTLRATADAYVRDGTTDAGTNFGTSGQLQVKQSTVGYTRESYLRFDLSSVASVASAKLRLFGKLDNTANASIGFSVYNATNTTWGETAITWNTKPAAATTASGSGTVSGTTAKWYEIDLTALLQQQKSAGASAVTLVLKASATSSSVIIFNSDEASASAPELVVTPASSATQALVVSTSTLTVPEGGNAAFTVKLAAQPASNVTVNVARATGGDTDLTTTTAGLTFTSANWNTAQSVSVAAAQDDDTTNGAASFTLSSAGLTSKSVLVTEADNDVPAPAPAVPVTLRASADAYVRDGSTYAGSNFGTSVQLHVKRDAVGYTRETYLRFDLSTVASVASAKLRLLGKLDNTANASVGFAVYNATNTTWGETAITWNTKPAAATTSSGSGTVSGTTATWYEIDVTALLQQQKSAGASAVTLVLKASATSSSVIIFNSDEASASAPELVVTPASSAPPASSATQALVVSTSTLTVPEGGNAAFTVKLAAQPASNVTVNVARATGDTDLTTTTAGLTFTSANWNTAQSASVAAAQDADTTHGAASFTVSSAGLTSKSVLATEADNDVPAPAPAVPVTLRASADAYVRDGTTYGGTNFGNSVQLHVKRGAVGYTRESYLRFDLSSVASVASAKLRIFGKLDNTENASVGFAVYNATNTTWGETAITWNTKPATATTASGSGAVSGTTAKWHEIDLTALLQQQKSAGAAAVTLVLKPTATSGSVIVFNSDEASSSAPELVVTPVS